MMTNGGLRTYGTSREFESVIRQQVPSFRGLPSFDAQVEAGDAV